MAGRKLTVLPSLGELPQQDDLMYLVDKSDTSESPQGTSKSVEFGELLQIGQYTPTFSAAVDCTPSLASSQPWDWYRIGDQVLIFGTGNIQLDALAIGGEFLFSLPVAPLNDFSNSFEIKGSLSINSVGVGGSGTIGDMISNLIVSDRDTPSKNGKIFVEVDASLAGAFIEFGIAISYKVTN